MLLFYDEQGWGFTLSFLVGGNEWSPNETAKAYLLAVAGNDIALSNRWDAKDIWSYSDKETHEEVVLAANIHPIRMMQVHVRWCRQLPDEFSNRLEPSHTTSR